ncbi:cation diffusion facilitator family transporter [Nafulsella turpanensis]|uniref:cation diffusion facilitator family transporter n=1 Tax=Nafulsella turpanensis TaxID=1265690 RepID=UPI0003459F6D|nr:cation diffusion facilitator family transporter [Nafulsella turpanensis]
MGHSHSHSHAHAHGATKNIAFAFFLNIGFTIFEIIGGFYVNSVAILSDALHDLGDSLSLGVSWYLQKKSEKGANEKFTFGYKRFSLLGALINSLVLILGSVFVVYQAIQRIMEPEPTDAKGMLLFAIVGVAVNGFAALRLRKGESMNEKVLSWHLMEDVLGWVAILVTSIVIMIWDIHILDPILSLCIAVFILWNVIKRLRETMYVFLQGAPKEVDLGELKTSIQQIEHVVSVHHTHLWMLNEENKVFTIHVTVDQLSGIPEIIRIKNKIKELLKGKQVSHATIDIEFEDETCYMENREH